MTRLPNAAPKPRRKPKKPRKPIQRSRVRQKAGKPKRFAKRRDYPYLAWIRERVCAIPAYATSTTLIGIGCGFYEGRSIEPAHIKTKASGGDDRNNVVPLCPAHHDEQEGHTKLFERAYGVDLRKLAQQYTERYDRERSVG